jgi:undecaprenyl pyrophosphate synthase
MGATIFERKLLPPVLQFLLMRKNKLSLPVGTLVPNHISLILDGNRRWARSRGLMPWQGHKAGYEAVKKLAKAARGLGVHTFTIWAHRGGLVEAELNRF